MAILVYQLAVTLLALAMVANGCVNLWFARRERERARRQPLPAPPPLVSVCIPARNEARSIVACVRSFARQSYLNLEILVLDDQSDDGTGDLARAEAARHPDRAIRVIDGTPLPRGWVGKSWACDQLARAAAGEYLLFTDADTQWQPGAVEHALRHAMAGRTDLLSGLPRLVTGSVAELLAVPILAWGGFSLIPLALVAHPAFKDQAAASGAFLFFRRAAYDRIHGHRGVRREIVEDLNLARRVKRCGLRLMMVDGSVMVECRMYTNLREVWEGFTKNFASAFPGPLSVLAIVALLALLVGPWLSLAIGPALRWGTASALWLPLAQIAAVGWTRATADRLFGTPSLAGLLLTPAAGIFCGIIGLRSLSRHILRHPTPWRARHYELWRDGEGDGI